MMGKPQLDWLDLVMCGLACVFLGLALGAITEEGGSKLLSPEAAGWAQALGTVIAIAASFVLGHRQAVAAFKDRQTQQQIELLSDIDFVLGQLDFIRIRVEKSLTQVLKLISREAAPNMALSTDVLRRCESSLTNLLAFRIGRNEARRLMEVRDNLCWAIAACDGFLEEGHASAVFMEYGHISVHRSLSSIKDAVDDLTAYRGRVAALCAT